VIRAEVCRALSIECGRGLLEDADTFRDWLYRRRRQPLWGDKGWIHGQENEDGELARLEVPLAVLYEVRMGAMALGVTLTSAH
jgi:hypothetical protein